MKSRAKTNGVGNWIVQKMPPEEIQSEEPEVECPNCENWKQAAASWQQAAEDWQQTAETWKTTAETWQRTAEDWQRKAGE